MESVTHVPICEHDVKPNNSPTRCKTDEVMVMLQNVL